MALTRACILAKGEKITVYTDSQYACSTLFYFAKQWDRIGMVTSTGKLITRSALLRDLSQAVLLLAQMAVCKFAADTRNTDNVSTGNRLAENTAKANAQGDYGSSDIYVSTSDENNTPIDQAELKDMQVAAPTSEKQLWLSKCATLDSHQYMW